MQLELFRTAQSETPDPGLREEWKTIKAFPLYEASAFGRFHHILNELRVKKTPLHGGRGWIKVAP